MSKEETKEKEEKEEKLAEKPQPEEEPKTYLNLGCCQIGVGIVFTYIYMAASISLTIVNRIIYHTHNFRFNFTFMLLQQISCAILFSTFGNRSKIFVKQAGKISFEDFSKHKYHYILFAFIFISNILSSFIGNQLVINVTMFTSLRKLIMIMLLFVDCCTGKKKVSTVNVVCVILLTTGTMIVAMDDFTVDYLGYGIVLINNTITIIYIKYSEVFRSKTGVSNLKLIIYNSYISTCVLPFAIFISGEYKRLYNFFWGPEPLFKGNLHSFIIVLCVSCTLTLILNSSFFISNEKNSSLITQLLANSKDIFISLISFVTLKNNKFSVKTVLGLCISTTGALLISVKSLCENVKSSDKKEKKEEGVEMEEKMLDNKEDVEKK